jgi:hypothetical protein
VAFSAPRHQRIRAGAILTKRKGNGMPSYDFKKPMNFLNALEQFSLALECVMVALRNEAKFHDSGDESVLNAANMYCSLLEDRHSESVALTNALEKRVLGMLP